MLILFVELYTIRLQAVARKNVKLFILILILLTYSKCLIFKDTDETGPLDLIKSQICDNVALYAQKYDEDFEVRVDFNSNWGAGMLQW